MPRKKLFTIKLTEEELEAVSYAVNNFTAGDAYDCGESSSRLDAMISAGEKLPCTKYEPPVDQDNEEEEEDE